MSVSKLNPLSDTFSGVGRRFFFRAVLEKLRIFSIICVLEQL